MWILGLKGLMAKQRDESICSGSQSEHRIQLYDNAEYCFSIFSSLGFPKLIKMTGMNLKELANDFLVSFFLSSLSTHCANPIFPALPVILVCYMFLPLY